jgi:hypothetical protein
VVLGEDKAVVQGGGTPVKFALVETRKVGPDVQLVIYGPTDRSA